MILKEPRFILRKYFTFEEMLDEISSTYEDIDYWSDFQSRCRASTKEAKIYGYEEYNAKFETVFNNLVNTFLKDYVFYVDYFFNEDEPTITTEKAQEKITLWLRRFYTIYANTKDRYLTLINIYEEQKDNLLNKVSENSKIKFNDTPQNAISTDYDNDEHVSTITTTERETDVEPLINRIESIYNRLKNLYKDWSDEFKGLFIYNTNKEI